MRLAQIDGLCACSVNFHEEDEVMRMGAVRLVLDGCCTLEIGKKRFLNVLL